MEAQLLTQVDRYSDHISFVYLWGEKGHTTLVVNPLASYSHYCFSDSSRNSFFFAVE